MGFALRTTQAKGGLGVVENKACMLYFFFFSEVWGGWARKSENQKIRKSLFASRICPLASCGPQYKGWKEHSEQFGYHIVRKYLEHWILRGLDCTRTERNIGNGGD